MRQPLVVLDNVVKRFGSHVAVKGINLEIREGEFLAVMGPSGCGKSTLLRVLNRMYDLYPGQRAEGEVLLDGENILNPSSKYTNNAIGIQLNVPIYSGGYVNSTIRQAMAALERAQQAYEATRRDLGVRVSKEYRGVTEGILRVSALEQALRSADQLVISNSKSYKAGSRTVVDVLDAEQQRMVVMHDLAQARYVYLISHLRLLSMTAEANEEAVSKLNVYLSSPAPEL